MSLESGGRADKIGNSYENRYLAKLLLRLVEETYTSVEVEPLGAENNGVEYITISQYLSMQATMKVTVSDLQPLVV